jgi:phosphoglycolate phosphatase
MNPARLRALVFDLDGTLIDSRQDLAAAVNRMRADLGLEELALPTIVAMVGRGARNLVRSALGGDPPEELTTRAVALFLGHYEPACTVSTVAYPGIGELLGDQAARRRLALLTNKPERPTRRILEHFGWSGRFEVVIGGDTLAARKPEPDGLLTIARRLGMASGEMLMVGDSAIDAATAAAAGAPFALAEWGFAAREEQAALRADLRASDPFALGRLLAVAADAPGAVPQ